jgi:hypothetical protein
MKIFRVPVVRLGGGFEKAVLMDGQETVFGKTSEEIAERLKVRFHVFVERRIKPNPLMPDKETLVCRQEKKR